MAEESHVSIVEWPSTGLPLEHRFSGGTPCPVAIAFAPNSAAHVALATEPNRPLDVNMNMQVAARKPLPLCISICEPICARSDYTVSIAVFDNPVASIAVRGLTRLFNCREEPPAEAICVGFDRLKPPADFGQPFTHDGLKVTPLGGPLHAATFGEPTGKVKLAFPPAGVRVTFPAPVHDIRVTVNNYAGPGVDFAVYSGNALLASLSEPLVNAAKSVALPHAGVTDIEVKGGQNESALVEVCYLPDKR